MMDLNELYALVSAAELVRERARLFNRFWDEWYRQIGNHPNMGQSFGNLVGWAKEHPEARQQLSDQLNAINALLVAAGWEEPVEIDEGEESPSPVVVEPVPF